jgi:4-amino-4-deoxy-L-arabinose transferase-like glycosyltransferase
MTAIAAGRQARVLQRENVTTAQRRHRYALWSLLGLTAALYVAGLSRNGWANDFYAAAVQAGTKSWKAFFFGSFDASNFITVDKTPMSLWVMELSARLFGLNYWTVLVPQALEGVASVGLLYAAVRRWHGPWAALLAGLTLAVTPVAALMFRFNNPDALLTLLLTGSAYATIRAIESGRTRWLVLAGTLLGFGFLTKMLQAFLVLPVFGLAYLLTGPRRLPARLAQLVAGFAAVLVSAGWWVAAVMLTPAADRPYVGGSTDNSILQLAIGYNGLGRIDGNETGSVGFSGNRGGGAGFSGGTGLGRLFGSDMGGQISWLLPAALIAIAALAWLGWRASRAGQPLRSPVPGAAAAASLPDRQSGASPAGDPALTGEWPAASGPGDAGSETRQFGPPQQEPNQFGAAHAGPAAPGQPAAVAEINRDLSSALVWGGWLIVTGAVFSYMAGIIHPYYTIALAPAIGALTGIGAVRLWQTGFLLAARCWLAAGIAATAMWSFALLERSASWLPALRLIVLAAGLIAAAALVVSPRLGALAGTARRRRAVAATVAGTAVLAALAGPVAYTASTIDSSHTGALPTAGPAVASSFGGPGGGGGFGGPRGGRGFGGRLRGGGPGTGTGRAGGFGGATGPGGFGGQGGFGRSGSRTGPGTHGSGQFPGGFGGRSGAGAGGFGGGLGGSTTVSSALTRMLEQDASAYAWTAATVGSESAAPLQLATGDPVMSIGGFNGTDPAPTLAQFEADVSAHKIHYFVGANADSFGGGSGSAAAITNWVASHFEATTVGSETVYNLTEPSS